MPLFCRAAKTGFNNLVKIRGAGLNPLVRHVISIGTLNISCCHDSHRKKNMHPSNSPFQKDNFSLPIVKHFSMFPL